MNEAVLVNNHENIPKLLQAPEAVPFQLGFNWKNEEEKNTFFQLLRIQLPVRPSVRHSHEQSHDDMRERYGALVSAITTVRVSTVFNKCFICPLIPVIFQS
jgi:hypothetical protein